MASSTESTATVSSSAPSSKPEPTKARKVMRDVPGIAKDSLLPKPTPPVESARKAKIVQDVTNQLDRLEIKKTMTKERGLDEGENEVIPPVVAKFPFMVLSKAIDCPKAELDEKEAQLASDCLSIIVPKLDEKVWALIMLGILTFMKLMECRDAVRNKLASIKDGSAKAPSTKGKPVFDKKTQAMKAKA